MKFEKESLAIHVLAWASRQTDMAANRDARVLLAIRALNHEAPTVSMIHKTTGIRTALIRESIARLLHFKLLTEDNTLTALGEYETDRITNQH